MTLSMDQLHLIAIMLKNQHGDKTFGELFNVNCVYDVKISDMIIGFNVKSDIDFYHGEDEILMAWITTGWHELAKSNCYIAIPLKGEEFARIDIVDVIKVLSFEDKV